MILVKPDFRFYNFPLYSTVLSVIESAGRTCYKSEGDDTIEGSEKFIRKIIEMGHHSVLEHFNLTAKLIVDRGVSHELVRHRLASYSQESTRYCNYKGGVTFVIPPWISLVPMEYNEFPYLTMMNRAETHWLKTMYEAEISYKVLLQDGWSPQQARSVLPNSLKTEIVITANIREWRHILTLRTSKAAHPQMREIMDMVLEHLKGYLPVFFEDIKEGN